MTEEDYSCLIGRFRAALVLEFCRGGAVDHFKNRSLSPGCLARPGDSSRTAAALSAPVHSAARAVPADRLETSAVYGAAPSVHGCERVRRVAPGHLRPRSGLWVLLCYPVLRGRSPSPTAPAVGPAPRSAALASGRALPGVTGAQASPLCPHRYVRPTLGDPRGGRIIFSKISDGRLPLTIFYPSVIIRPHLKITRASGEIGRRTTLRW